MRIALLFALAALLGTGGDALAQAEPLPERALARMGTTKLRHGSRILTLAFSRSGKQLLAAGGNDAIRLWDTETGKLQLQGSEIEPWVYSAVFTPRDAVFITAGAFKSVRFWKTLDGKPLEKLDKHLSPIRAMALSPDGTIVASGGQDGAIVLWELLVKQPMTEMKDHNDEVNHLAFSPDSLLLASAGSDRTLRIYDVDTTRLKHTVVAGCLPLAVAFVYEGREEKKELKLLASGGDDHLIRLWDAERGSLVDTLQGHKSAVVSLVATQRGRQLVSASAEGEVIVWDVASKSKLRTFTRNLGDADALALSRDGKLLATAGINNTIRLFDLEAGKEIELGKGPNAGIAQVALLDAGKTLASITTHGQVHVWDAATAAGIKSWNANTHPQQHAEFLLAASPQTKVLVTGSSLDRELHLWHPLEGKRVGSLPLPKDEVPLALAFAPGGKQLAVGMHSGKVDLWDVAAKQVAKSMKYAGPAYALAFNPKQTEQLAVSGDAKVQIFDVATGNELRQFFSKEGVPATSVPTVASIAWTPDGKSLALGCRDSFIRQVDADTGKEMRQFEGHGSIVNALAFSADGRNLVSASFDKSVRLWEVFSAKTIRIFSGHIGDVTSLSLSADGRTVFSASADTTILAWDITGVAGKLSGALKLEPFPFTQLWDQLAAVEASIGQPALWEIVASAEVGVALLDRKVAELLVDPLAIDRWLLELSSESYAVRTKATSELERKGIWMEDRLRESLKAADNLEAERRIQRMLEKLRGRLPLNQERLRMRRILMALEQLGSDEAVKLLRDLAQGAPEKELQYEAKQSLDRVLARRQGE
jgi:WD40 repeat protein